MCWSWKKHVGYYGGVQGSKKEKRHVFHLLAQMHLAKMNKVVDDVVICIKRQYGKNQVDTNSIFSLSDNCKVNFSMLID